MVKLQFRDKKAENEGRGILKIYGVHIVNATRNLLRLEYIEVNRHGI